MEKVLPGHPIPLQAPRDSGPENLSAWDSFPASNSLSRGESCCRGEKRSQEETSVLGEAFVLRETLL